MISIKLYQVVYAVIRKGGLVMDQQAKPLLQPVTMSDIIRFIPCKTVISYRIQEYCKRYKKNRNTYEVFRLNFHFLSLIG